MTSWSFFEELKKLFPPKLNHILGERRQQKLRLAVIFNPTVQFFVARAKHKIVKFLLVNFTFIWFQIKSQILSFALTHPFFKITKNWTVGLKIIVSLNFCCLISPKIWFGLGGDSFSSSWKKTLRGHNLKLWNNFDLKPS